jgi:DNA-binding transcriptional MerR regulator
MASDTGPLLAGQLARLVGVSTDTLRHYERQGLIRTAPRRGNGYRVYPRESLERVRVVRHALAMGFTIRELADILKARAKGSAPCGRVRELAVAKLQELDQRLEEMARLRESLARTIHDWDRRLAATPQGHRAGLLDSLIKGDTREDDYLRRDHRGGARRLGGGANAARQGGHGPSRPPGHGMGPVEGHPHVRAVERRRAHRDQGE